MFDLRKNMKIKATKLTEVPRTELVATTSRDRHGSDPRQTQAAASKPAAAAATAAPAPASALGAPRPRRRRRCPRPASPLPLLGLIGLASLVTGRVSPPGGVAAELGGQRRGERLARVLRR